MNRGYILLMSHMRSFSTLLAHILGSHPEIDGYTELHQHYESPLDLRAMTRRIETHTGTRRRGRYAFDKLLHNVGIVDPGILRRDDVKVVFLLRNARDTLPSILRASIVEDKVAPVGTPGAATFYYVTRLEQLDRYSKLLGARAAFVEAERLIADTDAVLAELTRYLGLATPLSPAYNRFKHTGERVMGDPGKNILAGRVLHDHEREPGGGEVEIPDDKIAEAAAAHAALLPKLRERHPAR
jgi:hypothetical protein